MEKLSNGISASEGFNSSRLLKQQETTWCLTREDIVHKLGITFDAAVQVEDVQPVRGCDFPSDENVEDKIPDSELHQNGDYSCSITFPPPRKLVSAMKGSPEKEGSPPRKLNVSWAPDVFDPPPTAASHTLKNTTWKRFKKNKKHVKGKQKGKTMRMRTKENYQKMSGRSVRHFNSDANTEELMLSNNTSSAEQLNFDNGDGTHSSCGTGILQQEHGSMQVAYAETT